MKKVMFYSIIACIFMVNTASTCSSDDDSSSSSSNPTDVINTVTSGTWRVTEFTEDDSNHTNYFSGFDFTFGSDNVLTATNGTTTHNGFWSVSNSSRSDGSRTGSDDLDFNISFSSPNNFTEISEDWDILERTDTKIRLRHVSGGDGSIDTLTFEKN